MRRLSAGIGAGIAALAIATPANAGTVTRSGTTLTYQAASGEVNTPQIAGSTQTQTITVDDGSSTIAPGDGCAQDPSSARVVCPQAGIALVRLRLGDLDDRLASLTPDNAITLPRGVRLEVDGGPGKDSVIGTKGNDVLSGGSGADKLFGSGGADMLRGGPGNDRLTGFGTLDGGAGDDFLEAFYGFGDEYKPFPTRVFAGPGNDAVLSGNKVPDRIDCGTGRDRATTSDKRGVDSLGKSCETRFG
jgi:Ca2+-binding RTX toxin-like protein